MNRRMKMINHKYHIILICLISLSFPGTTTAAGDQQVKNIKIMESTISIDRKDYPSSASLYITLKNNSGEKISNMTFEISYYGDGGYLIKKARVKNALNNPISSGEMQRYKVRLNGDVANVRNEQYPYSRQDEVIWFDVKMTNIKFASR